MLTNNIHKKHEIWHSNANRFESGASVGGLDFVLLISPPTYQWLTTTAVISSCFRDCKSVSLFCFLVGTVWYYSNVHTLSTSSKSRYTFHSCRKVVVVQHCVTVSRSVMLLEQNLNH